MSWFAYTPLVWPVLASAVFIGSVSAYVWRQHRTAPGARPLALSAFLLATVCLLVAAEVSTTDPRVLAMWFVLADAIMLPAALFALWFALDYAGQRDRVPRVVVPVLIVFVVARTLLLLVDLRLVLEGQSPLVGGVGQELGPLGLIFAVLVLGSLLLATTVLVLLFVRSPAHRVPVALILVGHVGLRVAYLYVALGSGDASRALVGVLAFDAVAVVYAIALTRFRLFDLVPVAREAIISQMPDPIFVLDRWDRTAALNPAAERLLGTSASSASGKPARAILNPFPQLVEALAKPDLDSAEIVTGSGDEARTWELRATPLHDGRGSPIGRLAVLHDVTEMRRAEAALLRHERALAAAREREHMARDLHDSIGQLLAHDAMQADAARQHLAEGRVREAEVLLERLAAVARDSHREVRGYIHELHAGPSDGQPLADTLRRYLDGLTEHHGIATEFTIEQPDAEFSLAADEEMQVFHVVQEALSNARRHAHASVIAVRLETNLSRLRVVVADDGRGFDVGEVDGKSLGLRFMHERAAELGGHLSLSSEPGEGTRLVLDVPHPASRSTASRSDQPVALGGAS
ncbi:MAG: histidine kinase N-terminal 7TM domain-containing protein [Candidatus Limnocylindrales bacterium]